MYVSYSKYCSLCAYVCIQEGVREGQVSEQSLQESLDAIEVSSECLHSILIRSHAYVHTLYRSHSIIDTQYSTTVEYVL